MVCANCVVATVPEEESLASSGRASRSASHSDVHRFKYLQSDSMSCCKLFCQYDSIGGFQDVCYNYVVVASSGRRNQSNTTGSVLHHRKLDHIEALLALQQ